MHSNTHTGMDEHKEHTRECIRLTVHFATWKPTKSDRDLKEFSWQNNLTWFEAVQLGDKYSNAKHQKCLKILFHSRFEIKSAVCVMTHNSDSFFFFYTKSGQRSELIPVHSNVGINLSFFPVNEKETQLALMYLGHLEEAQAPDMAWRGVRADSLITGWEFSEAAVG